MRTREGLELIRTTSLIGRSAVSRHYIQQKMRELGGTGATGRRIAPPPMSYNLVSWPDWIKSTSVFHASFLSTARLPTSPILTSPPSRTTSTSGHSVHIGHNDIFTWSILRPPFYLWTYRRVALF